MNVVCPACDRLVPLSAFRVDAGRLYLTCSRCGVESAAEGTAPPLPLPAPMATSEESTQVPSDAFAVPADRCPKCIAVRPAQASACPSCGLSFEGASVEEYAPSVELAAQWAELLAHWSDPEAHEKLVSAAALQGDLAPLGRLYQLRLAVVPEDAVARQGRDAVLARASVPAAFATPDRDSSSSQTWKVVLLSALIVGLVVVAISLIRLLVATRA
jgi:hypothetical protein